MAGVGIHSDGALQFANRACPYSWLTTIRTHLDWPSRQRPNRVFELDKQRSPCTRRVSARAHAMRVPFGRTRLVAPSAAICTRSGATLAMPTIFPAQRQTPSPPKFMRFNRLRHYIGGPGALARETPTDRARASGSGDGNQTLPESCGASVSPVSRRPPRRDSHWVESRRPLARVHQKL